MSEKKIFSLLHCVIRMLIGNCVYVLGAIYCSVKQNHDDWVH